MSAVRRSAVAAGVLAWAFAWYYIRGVRSEYAGGDIGVMPGWLTAVFGLTVLVTLGAAVAAGLRMPAWPWVALAAAVAFSAAVVAGQLAVMRSAVAAFAGGATPGVGDAVRAVLRTRGTLELTLIFGAPAALALAAASWSILVRRDIQEA